MRVLIVEDDAVIREMTSEALAEAGYEVDGLEFAEDALVLLGSGEAIDVLVTDFDLGAGLTGLDLAAIARSRYPDVELIFISGSGSDRDGRSPWPHEHLLLKPFRPSDLVELIRGIGASEAH